MTGSVPPTSVLPAGPSAADRLDSWKEIAAHLKRDVRTVQRWEKDHGLPVRRHVNAKQGSVFAYREELDAWWNTRRGELEGPAVQPRRTHSRAIRIGVAVAIVIAGVIAAGTLALMNRPTVTATPMVSLSVMLGPTVVLDTTPGGSKLALSPDGSQLAFVGRQSGRAGLFLRRLDEFESRLLPGTNDALPFSPFFSPDGRWVGFVTPAGIRRVAVDGGASELLFRAHEPEGGAIWRPDDTIIFSGGPREGLVRASVRGGAHHALTRVDAQRNELMHSDPSVLPGDRTVLYTVTLFDETGDHSRIDAVSLESADRRTILADGALVGYVAGAGLIFAKGTRVMAVGFDPDRLEVTGEAVTVLDDVADIAVTRDGMAVYTPASLPEYSFAWVDLRGREEPVAAPPRAYMNPRLSPSGREVATEIFDGNDFHVWIYDLARSALRPLTSERPARMPFWTRDGRRVVMSAPESGSFVLLSQPSDRSRPAELLTAKCGAGEGSFSTNGQLMFCTSPSGDIWAVSEGGRGAAKPFVQAPFIQGGPKVSPDDRWMAYMSDESGRWEVYLTALPGPHGKWQISTEGGGQPVWSRAGGTLFFRGGGKMMSVQIETTAASEPRVHAPVPLFADKYVEGHAGLTNYDVSADGSRLLMIKTDHPEQRSEIRVLQGWKAKLASLLEKRR